jgi:hypothetical protein
MRVHEYLSLSLSLSLSVYIEAVINSIIKLKGGYLLWYLGA